MDALADPHQSSATARPLQFLVESRSDTRCRGAAAMAGKLRDGLISSKSCQGYLGLERPTVLPA